ncbi:MAG TPA: protein translocase subunit SecD [Candidatus Megaira endosymbiont of Hartmannula sinica]|nr:protein translocase subunit SecD [Candidatus Megaera endosymbiont of Hartmannula sinica]
MFQDNIINQSSEVIRRRVDSDGTKEPLISKQGAVNILLQVPGEKDPKLLKERLGAVAKLSFHLVRDRNNNIIDQDNSSKNTRKKQAQQKLYFAENPKSFLYVDKTPIMTGAELKSARSSFDNNRLPAVSFSLNSLGATRFAEVTSKNRGKRLAIVLDNKIISAPTINSAILGGEGVISGKFSTDESIEMALLLNAGALPAPLKILEERTVGPSLGRDAIESGIKGFSLAFCLVALMMLLLYRVAGLIALLTLVFTLLYMFAMFSFAGATLTLPGIAGIILTIGMAVDANVLIFERIKEELDKKVEFSYAVFVGFKSAFNTIVDSNITTLIAAFLLYNFGVGAVKGFAVSLTIGIIASMYSSLVVSKILIDLWTNIAKPKKI